MLLDVAKTAQLGATPAAAWALIRDVPRLSGCIPNVSNLQEVEADRRYTAVVSEKLGPFRLQVPVQIELQAVNEPRQIVAGLSGNDSRGQARVRGTLEAVLDSAGQGTLLTLSVHLEVLGKLAALGAAPIRRRTDEIFDELLRRIVAELGSMASEAANHAGLPR